MKGCFDFILTIIAQYTIMHFHFSGNIIFCGYCNIIMPKNSCFAYSFL